MSHGGTERKEDCLAQSNRSRGGTVGTGSNGACFQALFRRYAQSICFKSYHVFVRYVSVALCAVSTSVLLRLSPFPPFLRVPYSVRSMVFQSIFQKYRKILSLTSEIITRHYLFTYKRTNLAHYTFILSTITGDCDAKSYKKT